MPGFKDGPVPTPSYESNNNNNQFSDVTEFINDVYVYGKLYADISAGDIDFGDTVTFQNVVINNSLINLGLSTFTGPVDLDYLTVKQRLDVGVSGTVFTAISTTNGYNGQGQTGGRVGIGSTQPDGRFQVGIGGETLDPKEPIDAFQSIFIVSDDGLIGIGLTQPNATLDVQNLQSSSLTLKVNEDVDSVVVTGVGTLGVGTESPGDFGINNSAHGELKADFDGSIHVARNIYDSVGSPGANGYFMNRDANGIRWVSFEPSFTEGIFIQDEGSYIPTVGAAQSFTVINFVQQNSFGQGTDTLIPTAQDPSSPTGLATIFTQDLWGHQGTGAGAAIYRQSRVGINQQNPQTQLDVNGDLHVTSDVDFNSNLNTDGDVTFNSTLDVDGVVTFNDTTDSSSTSSGALQVEGGVGIEKKLFVGDNTHILGTTESTSTTSGALKVDGGAGIVKNINVGGNADIAGTLDVQNTTDSTDIDNGAAVIDGGLGLAKNFNMGGNAVIAGTLDVDDTTQSTSVSTGAAVIDGGLGIAKNLNVGQNAKVFGNLELENFLVDVNDSTGVGICKTDYRLSSVVGAGVSWRPSGVQTKRTLYVTKNGCDTNSGLLEGDAKFTIGAAAAIAQEGDTIKVRSGIYTENNPIGLRTDVAITGEDLRLVLIIPQNVTKDVFHVRRGCLVENLSFTGNSINTNHPNCGAIAFPPTQEDIDNGFEFQAVSGYTAVGPANEGAGVGGALGRWRSPYIRNCTNFMTGSIGMKINGDHANAAFSGTNNLGQDLKSMVCDAFTQYNEAGVGVSISNNGYAQLVSIFTIGCEVGIGVSSGGQCDLTNSNSSFGIKGLVADGYGDIEFTGVTTGFTPAEEDKVVSIETKDVGNNNRIPFDGQGVYFHLDMNNYPDTPSTATVTAPLQLIRGIRVIDGGSGYLPTSPPVITVVDANNNNSPDPLGPEGILPEFSPNVSAAGTITSVDIINSGRNFLPNQNLQVQISSGSATFEVDTDPILFTVSEATDNVNFGTTSDGVPIVGISTVTFNEFIPYSLPERTEVKYVRLSRIITSSHSFEYIGAGTDINTSNPFQGGKPIPENEVVAINGGQVPFTSTDQKGNFRIGDGLTIDQTTSTIRGRDFNRAIQAQLTPLILALR